MAFIDDNVFAVSMNLKLQLSVLLNKRKSSFSSALFFFSKVFRRLENPIQEVLIYRIDQCMAVF